jgi:DNA-3-methyladenine glycosylase II
MDIPLRAPFDFTHTLGFLRSFSPTAGEQRLTQDTLVKSWIVRGRPVTVSMKQDGERLVCTVDARLDDTTESALRDRIAAFVSADEDLTELYALAARDERFAPVAKKLHGFHHPKFATPFEAACWSVINQRVQLAQARRMKAAIAARWGASGRDAFPEAEVLARATEKEIGRVIGNERKARAVWAVAQAFRDVDETWLRTAPLVDVDAWLRRIWGVGDFASGFVLYRGLGRARSLPWSDGFVRAARETYPGADRASLERKAKHYGPWIGHWALYLWAATLRSKAAA